MDKKLFDSKCITLDGKMDEAVWNEVSEYTDFTHFQTHGGQLQSVKTCFKIIPCEDRIYIGVKCYESDIEMAVRHRFTHAGYGKPSIQFFFCPSGKSFDFYQFFAGWDGVHMENFYSECGQIQPDPYAPEWRFETYTGEDYWSIEAEFPLTAFYMTPDELWSDTWLVNLGRVRCADKLFEYSSWAPVARNFMNPNEYLPISGFPIRPNEDDVYTSKIAVELEEKTADGYIGKMDVEIRSAVAGDFVFKTDHTEPLPVSVKAGVNEFSLPCFFAETGRTNVAITLTRVSDGKNFNRFYSIPAFYEPLVVKMTLPEYRNNFYPGQDYSKVVGKLITKKPANVTLEGPGIETQTITPDADGNFQFDTPNFEIGDAYLTATIDECSVKKKIRRLAPIDGTMTWISGGNVIMNGKPILPRLMYGPLWRGGTVFGERYQREEQYITPNFKRQHAYHMGPKSLIKGSETSGGEALEDRMPSDEMLRKLDMVIEANKGKDFAFYYLSDEPDLRRLSPIYLKNYYEYVADKDPYHICMMCFKRPDAYVECCDWLQTHPYIQPYMNPDGTRTYGEPVHLVGTHLDGIVQMNRPDKCMGFLPTCYAYKKHSKHYDYPTFDEVVTHTWAAMIHGGKSLWPYAYHGMNDRASMYQGFRYIFSSFEALEDIVLFGKRKTLQRSEQTESVLYTHGDVKMFVLVNFTQQEQTVTLDGIDGTNWYHFRHNGMLEGNTFKLKPFGAIIGTSEPRGEGLPSYDEVLALVEQKEYERTHTGNLLFDRHDEIDITSSSTIYPDRPKLFDGVRDNLGYELHLKEDQTENYFEMDLSKVAPSFNKVAVHGYQVDGMTVQIGNGEKLIDPEVIEVITEQYSTTIVLKDTVKPERLRLVFPLKTVELYEIEVF